MKPVLVTINEDLSENCSPCELVAIEELPYPTHFWGV